MHAVSRISRTLTVVFCLLPAAFLVSCCDNAGLPSAISDLDSSDAAVRNKAALSLARCGASADRAVFKLQKLLYDDNVGVQSSAAYALRKIDTPRARQVLQAAIDAREKRKSRR